MHGYTKEKHVLRGWLRRIEGQLGEIPIADAVKVGDGAAKVSELSEAIERRVKG
ncbi:MAG: hypothetical protein ACREP9_16000 [Candidatus Dormibacteraceae bacterium]